MINASPEFMRMLNADNRDFLEDILITFSDNSTLELKNENLWGGVTIEDSVSSDSDIQIGSTIINQARFSINNIYENYSSYDFIGARVDIWIGLALPSGTNEMLKKGVYTIADAKHNGDIISIVCYDNMYKFDKPYTESTVAYGYTTSTLLAVVTDACQHCGVPLSTYEFPRHLSYLLFKQQEDDKEDDSEWRRQTTFREVIGKVAQIAGCYARCNRFGELELKWFDIATVNNWRNGTDGGEFDRTTASSYQTGDTVNGGTFNPWNTGAEIDGGAFTEARKFHNITGLYNKDIGFEDTVITHIKVQVKDKGADAQHSLLTFTSQTIPPADAAEYSIVITNNEFIDKERAQSLINDIGFTFVGTRYRRANISHSSNPTIEAGDIAVVWDGKGRSYPILVTKTVFHVGTAQSTVSAGQNPVKNNATRTTEASKNFTEMRSLFNREKSARELAVESLAQRLASKSGLYTTIDSSGTGNIYYLHDQPTLNGSSIVWKMTAEAWGVTTAYNAEHPEQTVWNGGMTVDGDTLVRILTATGINADWINTGTISSQDGTVSIDLDNNTININGVTSFNDFETKTHLKTAGSTVINGANITTGTIKDANSNVIFDLSTGSLTMKKGSINIGNGKFVVGTDGTMSATGASIQGSLTTTIGNQKMIIFEALMLGYYNNVLTGTLDLCAQYNNLSEKHAVLKGEQYLHLHGVSEVRIEVGNSTAAWANSSGFYVNGGVTGTMNLGSGKSLTFKGGILTDMVV